MGIYYYAVDVEAKEYFSAPDSYAIKSPGFFHPENPFPGMVMMKNHYGSSFDIWDDCGHDVPPDDDYRDVTQEVYKEYRECFSEYYIDFEEEENSDSNK